MNSDSQSAKRDIEPAAVLDRKVLLVEDYQPNIIVATSFLETFGYAYDVAHDGIEAIAKVKAGYFDVVLMDVQMPQMDGFEATSRIRAREKQEGLKRLPIIGMTAHALKEDKELCLRVGMDDYIAKPFDWDELKSLLAKYANPSEASL